MRWSWVDHILEYEADRRMAAIKVVSRAEEQVHDHFETDDRFDAKAVMPASLIIEGMAQTAGILVGSVTKFAEKVILAKVVIARLERDVLPGQVIRFDATIERFDTDGASTTGELTVLPRPGRDWEPLGRIDLMFSHVDRNRSGLVFPEGNFVFSSQLREIVRDSGIESLVATLG